MTTIKLSKRLEKVAGYIPPETNVFADIGSDHAYLPCYVCLTHSSVKAIAGEVNVGPLEAAINQVKKYDLSNRIDVRLGNGLEVINPGEVDCIVIAGMGGTLITSILENGLSKLTSIKRLVLQPNIDAQSIREFAVKHQYEIIEEEILDEDGYIYEILVLESSSKAIHYSSKELYLGPILLQTKGEVFIRKWSGVLHKKERIIQQMKQSSNVQASKLNEFIQQTQWIKEEISDDDS
ncbi:tRNA (adenine(22)-N(1))-methyltransferase [Piscibacillus halophilus]|uniref:tRNA (adenine(22)-N(1))-methyltransferase n=1 Tax=Piscibacillus halophilus TaxID=571933 RepID=UPI00158A5C79|nr:tRNA (adenine(22)-N(1))-methyltransferase TrmK [Piscibacillus halophilus]